MLLKMVRAIIKSIAWFFIIVAAIVVAVLLTLSGRAFGVAWAVE